MQLKQSQQNEPVYDAETVRRTLARAAELEAEQTDSALTAAQIEALGRELGLSPDAVRRSLGELEATQQQTTPHAAVQTAASKSLPTFPKTSAIVGAVAPGVLYGVFLGILFAIEGGQIMVPGLGLIHPLLPLLVAFVVLWLPLILAFLNGWRSRDWRLGGLSGFVFAALSLVGVFVGLAIALPDAQGSAPGAWQIFLGVVLGALGGLCGRAYQRSRAARQRAANR